MQLHISFKPSYTRLPVDSITLYYSLLFPPTVPLRLFPLTLLDVFAVTVTPFLSLPQLVFAESYSRFD
jgi:hypothetical protein